MKVDRIELIDFLENSNNIEGYVGEPALGASVHAWEYIEKLNALTLPRILNTHEILMHPLNPQIAGRIRNCFVRVGGSTPPAPELVYGLLMEWIRIHGKAYTEEEIKEAHIQFEKIHPFEDGNGRVGRIVYNWQRLKNGHPLHIIHEGQEQFDYYKWFKG